MLGLVHLQPKVTFRLYIQLRDQLRARYTLAISALATAFRTSRELATFLGSHRTTVAKPYAETRIRRIDFKATSRAAPYSSNGNGLKLTPRLPMLGNNNGPPYAGGITLADEERRGKKKKLIAPDRRAPEDALSFVMASPASISFRWKVQICVTHRLMRREATDVLNLGSQRLRALQEALWALEQSMHCRQTNLLITTECQQRLLIISRKLLFAPPETAWGWENPSVSGGRCDFFQWRPLPAVSEVPVNTHAEPGKPRRRLSKLWKPRSRQACSSSSCDPDFHNRWSTSMRGLAPQTPRLASRHQVPVGRR